MCEFYMIDCPQHGALIRAARYGKYNGRLSYFDRCMCAAAEKDLSEITEVFERHRVACVMFTYAEYKIKALEKAWSMLKSDHLELGLSWDLLVGDYFPDFDSDKGSLLPDVSGRYK